MRYSAIFLAAVCLAAKATSQSVFDLEDTDDADFQLTPGACTFDHSGQISDACTTYSTIDEINTRLGPALRDLTQNLDYFGYYRLRLFGKECPFWTDDSGTCGNQACAVITIEDETSIPPIWRASELGKLQGPKASHPESSVPPTDPTPLGGQLGEDTDESCVMERDECDERDYCIPEDEIGTGEYVSLVENPERFTGYSGPSANQVWSAIYRENCFGSSVPGDAASPLSPFDAPPKAQLAASNALKTVLETVAPQGNLINLNDQCLEKRVFHKLVSGMHASISTHLCHQYLNRHTGLWSPNLSCFLSRFSGHPERIQNIYFNYALLLRAVAKLSKHLEEYTFCVADPAQNLVTKQKVLEFANEAKKHAGVFDETVMFQPSQLGVELKEDFKNKFRNISRIMDCVGCDKCRLWGKIQTQGYGTALKVLFEFGEKPEPGNMLRRTELVALVNTLARLSYSVQAVEEFGSMIEAREKTKQGTFNIRGKGEKVVIDGKGGAEKVNVEKLVEVQLQKGTATVQAVTVKTSEAATQETEAPEVDDGMTVVGEGFFDTDEESDVDSGVDVSPASKSNSSASTQSTQKSATSTTQQKVKPKSTAATQVPDGAIKVDSLLGGSMGGALNNVAAGFHGSSEGAVLEDV